MNKTVIELQNVWKSYKSDGQEFIALKDITLEIKRGEFILVMGRSGSGKSTLLHLMGIMDSPTKGDIFLDNMNISEMDEDERAEMRLKKIGFVFQFFNLFNEMTALENIAVPLIIGNDSNAFSRAEELIELVGLKNKKNSTPNKLSGGQRQRIAIARALVNNPSIVLCDEPTGNLDTKSRDDIFHLLQKINEEENQTIVIITHDNELKEYANRIISLSDGEII